MAVGGLCIRALCAFVIKPKILVGSTPELPAPLESAGGLTSECADHVSAALQVTPEEAEAGQKRLEAYREYCAELKAQGQVGATWLCMCAMML